MFQVDQPAPNRLNITIQGKIDKEDMQQALDNLFEKSEQIENGKMLYRITDFSFPTLAAIGVEMTYVPKLFSLIHRFDYAALLTDEKWMQTAGEIKGALIPGLEIKAFNLDEEDKAEAWLASRGNA